MDVSRVLVDHYSGLDWVLNGEEYSGLVWNDDSPKPTKKKLEKLWEQDADKREKASKDAARKAAYDMAGATGNALIVALWEKVMEDNPGAADALQAKRVAVKSDNPA
tara:strand:- start:43 stop:363 length:321 start_codon:yes stop_codon:yes gene_type:complete